MTDDVLLQQEAAPVFQGVPLADIALELWQGKSVEKVGERFGLKHEPFVRALSSLGLRPVRRTTLEPLTPAPAVLDAVNVSGRDPQTGKPS